MIEVFIETTFIYPVTYMREIRHGCSKIRTVINVNIYCTGLITYRKYFCWPKISEIMSTLSKLIGESPLLSELNNYSNSN